MKKTINVNMFGMLYPFDEDAYNLLNNYLQSLQKYFMSHPGGQEIVTDIEARVAELINELISSGVQSVSVADIKNIITRIGSPEELGSDNEPEPETHSDTMPEAPARKKLFRDTERGVVAGVLAGLAEYTGMKLSWLRIIAVIFVFVSCGWFIAAYLIAWVCIPAAETPLQRLEMKGEPVNMETIRNMILENVNKMRTGSELPGLATRLGQIIGAIFRGIAYIACGGLIIAAVCALAFVIFLYIQSIMATSGGTIVFDEIFALSISACPTAMITVAFISAAVGLILVITLASYSIFILSGHKSRVRPWVAIAAIILFTVSAGIFFSTFIPLATAYKNEANRHYRDRYEDYRSAERSRSEKILNADGWIIARDNNVRGDLVNKGEHYSGYSNKYYLDVWESEGTMAAEIVREEKVAPGTYTLSAVARTNGEGVEIFAHTSAGRYASPVIAYGNEGGEIWNKAVEALADTTLTDSNRMLMKQYADANNSHGYGWSRVNIGNIEVAGDSLITYGITNLSPASGWNGSWFSATEFILHKN